MSNPVREYVKRVASIDLESFPRWDLKKPLPKLPVPRLHDTIGRYLLAIQPLVSDEQYDKTAKLCRDFLESGGLGEELQEKLLDIADESDNWVYQFWLDDMYMKPRLSLPVNSNPGMVFPKQYFEDQDAQLRFAARLISGILDYKTIIDSHDLPIDRCTSREKGQPLCMNQYYRLFSSYRVPGVNKDSLVISSSSIMPEPEHVIVICKNQFFVLDILVNFTRLSDDNMYTQLKRIVKQANESEEDNELNEPIGILTSLDRDSWANNRIRLMNDSTNRDTLDMIERCIFVLCLDKPMPLSFNHQRSIDETMHNLRDDVSLASQMLHGSGSKYNSCNRWFDKTMQFIISEDGACGLCYEHSPSEGIAVVRLIEHLLAYMEEKRKRRLPRMHSICELAKPRKLHWKTDVQVTKAIQHAKYTLDKLITTLDLYCLRFEHYGKDFPKSQNMSPDSFIQLALQLTYYKVHGCLVSTYESASIRRYRNGRVDVIRSAHMKALEWVKAMVGETECDDTEKMKLFREAVRHQTRVMTQAILGEGIDNHLLGLRAVATEVLGRETPEIFQDRTFIESNQFILSTSQVPTTMDTFMCYGPVVHDGYGVCYNPHPGYMIFAVTSFNPCDKTRSDFFAYTIESSLRQMREVCLKDYEMRLSSTPNGNASHSLKSNGTLNGVSK
ncbi:unnamed protein product [Owenia fusiformis]|uniref:Choline O-acetyltransferase n=1 Tax=Owenia fusiformis TaxID=6347 RepID=A0A2I6EEG0_OWEFU|nr:ChAT protein [Owenia fusiformis]CAH1795027.1 unnamed protein product [Owenia fusiformis]